MDTKTVGQLTDQQLWALDTQGFTIVRQALSAAEVAAALTAAALAATGKRAIHA